MLYYKSVSNIVQIDQQKLKMRLFKSGVDLSRRDPQINRILELAQSYDEPDIELRDNPNIRPILMKIEAYHELALTQLVDLYNK